MTVNPNPYARRPAARAAGPDGLADVLERILDKGLVIAGDIQINLLDIELITIKVRLLLASADTAQQMGIDWWKHDPFLTSKDRELAQENQVLRDRVDQLEAAMGRKLVPGEPSPGDLWGEGATDEGSRRGQRLPTGAMTGGQEDGASSGDREGSAHQEVDVDELILAHEAGGPGLRVTSAGEEEVGADEQHVEGVEELILEREEGGPELRVTAADLEELAEQQEASEEPEDAGQEDGASSGDREGSAHQELDVDELILAHEEGGPGLRVTSAGEEEVGADEQHVEGVEELILEREEGGPELRVTAADLEELAEQQEAPDEAPDEASDDGSDDGSDDEQYWLDEESIASMSKAELQAELEARGLSTTGNKAPLRERLLEALEDEWELVEEDEDTNGSETAGD